MLTWMISPLPKIWGIFLQMYNFLLHCFTGEVLSFPIMVPAWILQLQQKNAQPLVQDPCKAQLWPSIFYVDFWMISPLSKNYEEYFLKCITSFYIVLQAKYWVFPLWFLHEYFSSNRKMPNLLCKILAKRSRLWLGRKCLSLGMWNEKGNLWVRALFLMKKKYYEKKSFED